MVLSFARAKKHAAPASPRCVLIGPVGAGKSTLIASLRHQADGAHSYVDRFGVEIAAAESPLNELGRRAEPAAADANSPEAAPKSPENPERAAGASEDFQRYERIMDKSIRNGLDFEATFTDRVFELSFRLTLRAMTRSGLFRPDRVYSEVFKTIDAAGGLLLDDPLESSGDPAAQAARSRIGEELLDAENVLLCLPTSGFSTNPNRAQGEVGAVISPAHQRGLVDLLRGLREHPSAKTRRLVVVLTKFEAAVSSFGRQAYRVAASRAHARDVCSASLHDYWDWLTPSLVAFEETPGRDVFVQPVSTFGFIPYSGGPNLDPRTELLRTRTPPKDSEPRTTKTPYTFEAVHSYYWRPFLTLDPFIFIATGEPGYLTFPLSEALEP
ncbi:MAG: hypothetical protein AAF661_17835 [Pseudomonadota bacterium]